MDEEQIKIANQLARKITFMVTSLKAMKSFAAESPDVINRNQVHSRIDELNAMSQSFEELQDKLELLENKPDEERIEERLNFQSLMMDVKACLKGMLDNNSIDSISETTSAGREGRNRTLRLPAIEIPIFDGNLQNWTSFIDSFNAVFHDHPDLEPVQKFQFLKSHLTGTASDVVKTIPLTNDNYRQAYAKLAERYENPGLIIQSHIRALFDTPKVQFASASQLHQLHHHVVTNVRALESLKQPVKEWDAWLVTLLCCRLDNITVSEWQLRQTSKQLPTFTELEQFLSNRVNAYEAGEIAIGSTVNDKHSKIKATKNQGTKACFVAQEIKNSQCPICSHKHEIYRCFKFKNMTVLERQEAVRKQNLCFNCLSTGHSYSSCTAGKCRNCSKKHNTLLHSDTISSTEPDQQSPAQSSPETPTPPVEPQGAPRVLCAHSQNNSHVLLGTAIVNIENSTGRLIKARAVLDSGSQINLISTKLANKLNVQKHKGTMPICGVGSSVMNTSSWIHGQLHSLHSKYSKKVEMSIISAITHQLPAVYINVIQWQLPEHVQNNLADPEFYKPGNIDLLLGAELFFDLLGNEQVKVNNQLVTIRNTKLGWIVSGKVNQAQRPVPSMCLLSSIYSNDDKPSTLCNEAVECEEHFRSTYTRNKEGRFSLKLPIKDKSILGSSYNMARQRFFSLEKRLSQDNELRSRYIIFLQEYEALGHMSQIKNVDAVHTNCYYLPHHAVLRAESLTTKTRVVFDASAKTTSGKSLNDMLMNGGVVQDDLVSILLRFRMHRFVMTADIEKMYRQILIDQEHRNYQRILWRDSPEKELLHFQLNTVTYGTTSAPFQATRCLQELANINKAKHPQAAQVIRQDFYVDDLITGSHSISRCQEIQREVTMILQSAGMTLRKWCANSPQLIVNIANSNDDPHVMLELNDNDTTKTLGLVWNPRDDQLLFKVSTHAKGHVFTKRTLLANLNRVFDPLGFLAPVLISGKIFIQQLWQLQLDWDTVLPADMSQRWQNYTNELCQIDQLKVVRKVKDHPCNSFELHGFCDASMNAYGACIYVRQLQPDNTFTCHLLIAKARVAPLKALSIPRLELCSAHVLATLMAKVRRTLDVSSNCCTCWTDSSVALTWIRGISSQWSTFVANRVSEFQTLTEEMTWQHVRTKFNPADLTSRGVKVQDLLHSNLWWYGPIFLQQPKTEWPAECSSAPSSELLEKRPVQFALLVQTQENSILAKYSSWTKLIRITAYLKRFIHNTHHKCRDSLIGPLSVTELKTAKDVWIRIAQTEAFYDEVKSLNQGKSLSSHSKLITLSPFLEEGIIRVGGRLQRSHLPINQRHPAILPKKHTVTELIFTEYHIKYLHAGPQNLLTRVRQEYWPLDAMKTARRIVHCCQICYRARPQSFQPSMGELPRLRVTPSRPFTATGVDFAGPIQIYSGPRNRTVTKAYIAVFVCFSTRAIHLEAVSNLSAQAFLAALRRFFARRGQSAHIHSDNGTNFHDARAEMRRYYTEHCQNNKTIIESLATDGTEWHFNPPSAPHMGGLWEAAVKSTKHHLLRITGSAKLNFEELTTMLCQIEACLNSRPLTAQSSDPESFTVLTPAHFLVGGCLTLPPEPQHPEQPINYLKRWQLVQGMTQGFWRRWSSEYLRSLQPRTRWTTANKLSIKIGDLVLVIEENQPPLKWHLGRVMKLHPGLDSIVRVVTIQMSGGRMFQRPIVKLCPLPYAANDEVPPSLQEGENVMA